jgi:hypothetical protein
MQILVGEAEGSLATLELIVDPIAAVHQALGAIRTLGEQDGESSTGIQLSVSFKDGDDSITGDKVGGTIAFLGHGMFLMRDIISKVLDLSSLAFLGLIIAPNARAILTIGVLARALDDFGATKVAMGR